MPAIEVSCPSCGKVNIIETEPHKPMKGGLVEMLESMVADIGVKKYSFEGEGHCSQCGEIVDVCVSVANRIKKEGIPWSNLRMLRT